MTLRWTKALHTRWNRLTSARMSCLLPMSVLLNQAVVRVPVLVADRAAGVTDFLAVVRGPLDDVGREEVGVLTLSGASGELLVVVALSRRLQVREERFERLDRRAEGPDPGAQLVVDVGLAPVVEVQLEPGPVPPIGRDLGVEQAQGRAVAYAQARGEGRGYDEGLVEDHGCTTLILLNRCALRSAACVSHVKIACRSFCSTRLISTPREQPLRGCNIHSVSVTCAAEAVKTLPLPPHSGHLSGMPSRFRRALVKIQRLIPS